MSIKDIFINEMDAEPCFYCKFTTPKTCQNCKDEIECFISNLSMTNELEKAKNQLTSITTDYVFLIEPTRNLFKSTINIEDTSGNEVMFINNVESYINKSFEEALIYVKNCVEDKNSNIKILQNIFPQILQ